MKKWTAFPRLFYRVLRPSLPFLLVLLILPAVSGAEENGNTENLPAEALTAPVESAITQRRAFEKKMSASRFAIMPHKPNYLLPATYNSSVNNEPYTGTDRNLELKEIEVKFQVSFKTPLWERIAGRGTLYAGYTQQSHWQAYNSDASSPFRETNYQPEIFLTFDNDYSLLGVRNRLITLGFEHQSNGRSEPLSRSWNRLYAQFAFERGNLYFALRPWYRLPESRSSDDNPDIHKYMGYGEFNAVYTWGNHRFGLMLRNNFRAENYGAVQVDWSFPLHPRFDGYIQYFNGYGESLIDYNHSTNRIGVGIIIANWL
ncbi:phospholipase A [Desulfuromonas sp. KJ2020]|uniref:phospholipase A n=1 Tax=Desulfuromonas sp. KJ2020 TaxID=2919173 RepID=UPI0020A6DD1B|nr:phospholipase A [Desulfuromonas sp. KJ2020]MCP3177205.1 phospholipase A [Desulfuromonas sp. KJ2020]